MDEQHYQPPEPNETLSMPPNYRFNGEKPKKKKKRVKLIVGEDHKVAKKSSSNNEVELYDILQALRVEDMIRIRGPIGQRKDSVVAALYEYCILRTKNFQRGEIFWLPPTEGVVPVEDSLYGDLCQCLDILQDSSIVQDSPEERWDKDEMLMEYRDRIDIEMEFMKPLLIVDYSLITFVSADAETGFERFLSHLMVTSNAKIIKIETSGNLDDPLSNQSQSTGESTNSSSEALTEIIKFLEDEDQRERQRERKALLPSDATSSLAYSEDFCYQSESGATVESATTVDSVSVLAGTKLLGSLMEDVSTSSSVVEHHRTTTRHSSSSRMMFETTTSSSLGEPSSEDRYYMGDDDYYFTTPPTTRSIVNKNKRMMSSNRQQTTTTSPIHPLEDYSTRRPAKSESYEEESTTIIEESRFQRTDSHTTSRSKRMKRNRKVVQDDEESYFSQASSKPTTSSRLGKLLCGMDFGDKSLRRFFCFHFWSWG